MPVNARTVHVDAALTNVSIKYNPTGFIADKVSPIIPVKFRSDKYYIWNRGDSFRSYDDLRAPGTASKKIDHKLETGLYSVENYSLKAGIDDDTMANADSVLKLKINKTERVKMALMIGREKRVAALFTNPANYASTNKVTLSGTSQWDNASFAGNPVDDIDTGIEGVRKQIGIRPNTLIMPEGVANVFKNDSNVIELLKYTKGDMLEGTGLPKTIRGLNLHIPGAVQNTATEGAVDSIADIWGKHVVIAYVNPGATIDSVSFSYTFRNKGYTTKSWYDEEYETTYIEGKYAEDNKVVSNVAGYLIENAIS